MDNVNITDIEIGRPKTIAVSFTYQDNPYMIKDWIPEIIFFKNTDEKVIIKSTFKTDNLVTFYISSKSTTEIGQLKAINQGASNITTGSRDVQYKVNLVKELKEDELFLDGETNITIPLFSGKVILNKEI